jgi:hypothetical protein
MRGIIERYNHFREIARWWWALILALWSAFWLIDTMIAKWGDPPLKKLWDQNTLHIPRGWQYWVIGLLGISILLVIEGSFRHSRQFQGSNILEEYDPKVYLEPLNAEFFSTGLIPFDMFNNGQRVNIAHRIRVQPIPLLPTVTFEYVNHLEMNQHKRLLPLLGDAGPFENRNILSALERAFQEETNRIGNTVSDFPFEITINYEDVIGRKKYSTKVGLVYSPLQHVLAINHALAANRRECKIIELVSMDVRRLS